MQRIKVKNHNNNFVILKHGRLVVEIATYNKGTLPFSDGQKKYENFILLKGYGPSTLSSYNGREKLF